MNSILVPHYVKYKRNANGGDSIRQLSGVTCHFNQFHACGTYAVSQVNEFVFSVCLTFGVRFQTANKYRFAVAVAATFLKYSSQLYKSNILNTTPNCYDIGAIHLHDCMYYLHRCKYTISTTRKLGLRCFQVLYAFTLIGASLGLASVS